MDGINESLLEKKRTVKEWLDYYEASWTRNVVARTVDMMVDEARVAANPNEMVFVHPGTEDMRQMKIIQRLDMRKQAVADGLEILHSIKSMLALPEGEVESRLWSEEHLKLNPDIQPRKYRVIKDDGLKLEGGQLFIKGTVLVLDPTDDQVKGYLTDGTIEEMDDKIEQQAA